MARASKEAGREVSLRANSQMVRRVPTPKAKDRNRRPHSWPPRSLAAAQTPRRYQGGVEWPAARAAAAEDFKAARATQASSVHKSRAARSLRRKANARTQIRARTNGAATAGDRRRRPRLAKKLATLILFQLL